MRAFARNSSAPTLSGCERMSSRSGPLRRAWRANLFSPVRFTVEPGFMESWTVATFKGKATVSSLRASD